MRLRKLHFVQSALHSYISHPSNVYDKNLTWRGPASVKLVVSPGFSTTKAVESTCINRFCSIRSAF
eukprot:scaffold113793_cov43-Prasinocladus_malaysianus.AAC.1